MKGGLEEIMKQAQDLQSKMMASQDELAKKLVVGESGAGLVKITLSCKHEARKVEIDPSLTGDDKEMLEDLIAAAINDAAHKIEEETKGQLGSMLNLPPNFKMPF